MVLVLPLPNLKVGEQVLAHHDAHDLQRGSRLFFENLLASPSDLIVILLYGVLVLYQFIFSLFFPRASR